MIIEVPVGLSIDRVGKEKSISERLVNPDAGNIVTTCSAPFEDQDVGPSPASYSHQGVDLQL